MPDLQYTLIKSDRRTISVEISGGRGVIVRCPLFMSEREADAFVRKRAAWIEKHLARAREMAESRPVFDFSDECDDREIFCLGEKYIVRLLEDISEPVFTAGELRIPKALSLTDRALVAKKFFRGKLAEMLPGLIGKWSEITGLIPDGVKITDAKTRWGSCGIRGGKNRLCFSWRLACADMELVEYVVLHELCHIRHHNHSRDFYSFLGGFMPDHKEKALRLRSVAAMPGPYYVK